MKNQTSHLVYAEHINYVKQLNLPEFRHRTTTFGRIRGESNVMQFAGIRLYHRHHLHHLHHPHHHLRAAIHVHGNNRTIYAEANKSS
jgi:hypothetical protein